MMNSDELFWRVSERIARAKKKPAFETFQKFQLAVLRAEGMFRAKGVKLAGEMIDEAEKILLRHEILGIAVSKDPEVLAMVRELVLAGKLDEAMSMVLV